MELTDSLKALFIDTSKALAVPGVRAVLTGEDVRGIRYGRRLYDVPILAGNLFPGVNPGDGPADVGVCGHWLNSV